MGAVNLKLNVRIYTLLPAIFGKMNRMIYYSYYIVICGLLGFESLSRSWSLSSSMDLVSVSSSMILF